MIFMLVFPLAGLCQTKTKEGKIWLTNSRGERIGGADTVVARKFFDAEWIRIEPDYSVSPQAEWWFVVRSSNQCSSGVHQFKTTEIPPDIIQKIRLLNGDGINIMLFFQPDNPEDWDPKKNKLDFRLLE